MSNPNKPEPVNPDPKTHPIHPAIPNQPIHEPLQTGEGTDPKRPVTPETDPNVPQM